MRALLGLALLTLAATAAASKGEVEYRQHTMKAIGGHMQAMADILRQKVTHTEHLALHANALADLSGVADTLWPEGSEGGETLPAVWSDPTDFAKRLAAFREAAQGLKAALAEGAEVGPAFKPLSEACKGCHDNYQKD